MLSKSEQKPYAFKHCCQEVIKNLVCVLTCLSKTCQRTYVFFQTCLSKNAQITCVYACTNIIVTSVHVIAVLHMQKDKDRERNTEIKKEIKKERIKEVKKVICNAKLLSAYSACL